MGLYNSAVTTTAGQSLIARAIAGNLPCTLTSAKTTAYVVPGSTSLASLTSLPDIKQSEAITSASVVSNTQVSASVRFNNTDITLNYMINTIGVYAKVQGDTSETLLAVITAIDPDVMPSYSAASPVAYVYDITLSISNASSVNIVVAPTGSPNYSEFNLVKDEVVAARVGADNVTYSTLGDAIRGQVTDLKNQTNAIAEVLSDGNTLLSDALTDKNSTSAGVTYSLSGNTLTCAGTATGESLFTWIGSTVSVPTFIERGKAYCIEVKSSNANLEFFIQYKLDSASGNTMLTRFREGKQIVTIPESLYSLRLCTYVSPGSVADGTMTVEVSNAIASIDLENDIKAIEANYFALDSDNAIMIPDNTDFDALTTPGTYKVTNNTHAATMTHIPEEIAGKLVVVATAQASRLTQLYFTIGDAADIYIRTYNSGGWKLWFRLLRDQEYAAPIRVGDYATESGDIAESFSVYIPATKGYIKYVIRHYISDSKNCNGWQIYHAYHLDSKFGNETDLTITGEWECALHLSGRDDFSGGYTHGDEIMSDVLFLVDGIPTDISGLIDRARAKEFRIIQTSIMYDPADHSTAIAEHGKEYVFTKDGLKINQTVKWLMAESLENCFLCMFLPSKNYIDRAAANSDFKTCILPSATGQPLTTIVKDKANAVDMWDTASGFSANVSVPVYPTGLTGGDQISISDNGGNNYNKLYFKACGGGTSAVGELWKSTSVYKLNFS